DPGRLRERQRAALARAPPGRGAGVELLATAPRTRAGVRARVLAAVCKGGDDAEQAVERDRCRDQPPPESGHRTLGTGIPAKPGGRCRDLRWLPLESTPRNHEENLTGRPASCQPTTVTSKDAHRA